jgi:hypothetical protein
MVMIRLAIDSSAFNINEHADERTNHIQPNEWDFV